MNRVNYSLVLGGATTSIISGIVTVMVIVFKSGVIKSVDGGAIKTVPQVKQYNSLW